MPAIKSCAGWIWFLADGVNSTTNQPWSAVKLTWFRMNKLNSMTDWIKFETNLVNSPSDKVKWDIEKPDSVTGKDFSIAEKCNSHKSQIKTAPEKIKSLTKILTSLAENWTIHLFRLQ